NPRITSPAVAEPQNVVDASLSISPLTSVNEVNHAETFTITVTAFPAGTGTPDFATPAVTFAGGTPGTVTGPTLRGITGNVAPTTETITNATAGTFTVQASAMVTMGGVTVTRTTGDGLSGDSPSAVKNYVDATISITPQTAANEVNQQETFTITVTADPAGTGTPTFATPTVTFPDGTPSTVAGPNLVGITGNLATYTLSINTTTPGMFTVEATAMVTMGGVTVTRTTGDGLSGDSPSAVKTYVDGFITIGPDGANLVGDPHTFTVTVDENTGNGLGYLPAANETVTVTLTNVNGAVANPAGPFNLTTNSGGQATVAFTSATAGEVIGNASTTLMVNGVTPTRAPP